MSYLLYFVHGLWYLQSIYIISSINICWLYYWLNLTEWDIISDPILFSQGLNFCLWPKKNQPNHQVTLRQYNKGSLGSLPGFTYWLKHSRFWATFHSFSKPPQGHKTISRTKSSPTATKYNYHSLLLYFKLNTSSASTISNCP